MATPPTYAELRAYMIGTGAPLEAAEHIDEGIYHYAKKRRWQHVLAECPHVPQPLDVLSSESVAALVFEMLEDEYERLGEQSLYDLLGKVDGVEEKDLYDADPNDKEN